MDAYRNKSEQLSHSVGLLSATNPHDVEQLLLNIKKVKEACAECLKTLSATQPTTQTEWRK
jgi:hypothetical protein